MPGKQSGAYFNGAESDGTMLRNNIYLFGDAYLPLLALQTQQVGAVIQRSPRFSLVLIPHAH